MIQVRNEMVSQPNIIDLKLRDSQKINIVGDLHGQYSALESIFSIAGTPEDDNVFLFNGGGYSFLFLFLLSKLALMDFLKKKNFFCLFS